ncbi:MAG: NAD(P)/FAD-dependent oxidoreductase [Candidatus Helarchaeota archaeon]
MTKYVIVGNGIAGINAASILRREDPSSTIEIYTDESYLTYSRPKLPGYIANLVDFQDLFIRNEEYYQENDIKLYLSSKVINIHPDKKQIELYNGSKIQYDKLLLAAGSHAFIPPIKGANKKNVMSVRSLDDANKLINLLKISEKVIVIGGGLLGIEIANSIRLHGNSVTIVEFYPRLLPRQLDVEGAKFLQNILEKKGIKVVLGAVTDEIPGEDIATGIKLKDGRSIPADCIVISAGMHPNIHIVEKTNINFNRGIIVNEYMETNYPDIFAAGDIAEFNGRVWGIIPAAFAQSKIAAINMVHSRKEKYQDIIPSNTLKVADIDLTSMGTVYFDHKLENIIEKRIIDEKNSIYKKLVVKKETGSMNVLGAILIGDKTNSQKIFKLIREKIDVSKFLDSILVNEFDLNQKNI